MYMTRTFHPVGQGGFFTEVFRDDSSKKKFTVAYDVGSNTADKKYLQEAIDLVGKVDVVFLSHLHKDHINGLPLLLQKKENEQLKIIMPVLSIEEQLETALYNMITSEGSYLVYNEDTFAAEYNINKESIVTIAKSGDVSPEGRESIEDIKGNNKHTILSYKNSWLYIPYNPKAVKENELIDNIKKSKDLQSIIDNKDKINDEAIRKAFVDSNIKEKLREVYKTTCGNHNAYSMIVYSGLEKETKIDLAKLTGSVYANCEVCHYCHHLPHHRHFGELVNCLYTGDAELKSFEKLKSYYGSYWDIIGIIQVPHHGSRNNFNVDLCYPHPCLFVISVGSNNCYGHPSVSVINEIYENDGCLSIITESSVPLSFKYEF